jgi:hypothetical protein
MAMFLGELQFIPDVFRIYVKSRLPRFVATVESRYRYFAETNAKFAFN